MLCGQGFRDEKSLHVEFRGLTNKENCAGRYQRVPLRSDETTAREGIESWPVASALYGANKKGGNSNAVASKVQPEIIVGEALRDASTSNPGLLHRPSWWSRMV